MTNPVPDEAEQEVTSTPVPGKNTDGLDPIDWKQTAQEGKAWAFRNRRQLVPWGAAAGTWAAGAGAAALTGSASLLPLAAGWAGAGAAYGYAHKRSTHWQRVYAAGCSVCSAAWQALAEVNGAGGGWGVALVGGALVLGIPWWVKHAEVDPDTEAELASGLVPLEPKQIQNTQKSPQPPPPEDERAREYRRFVKIGKLSEIHDITAEAVGVGVIGWRGQVVQNKPGHWENVLRHRQQIASTYDQPDSRIYVDPIDNGNGSARVAELTVINRDILVDGLRWQQPGLDPNRGSFPVMLAADGTILSFQLWRPGHGAKHALVAGTTGSGKSALFDLIFTEVAYSSFYVPLLIDGGDGSSSPAWTRSPAVPHVALTLSDAHALLTYVIKIMQRRKRALNHVRWIDKNGQQRIGVSQIDPSPQMPGIAILVDEAHNLLTVDDTIRAMLERIAKEGRKVGISLVLATQVPSAKELGNSTILRNMLKSGTVIGLRTTESTAANMTSSGRALPEALHLLPEQFWMDGPTTEGLGYMLTQPRLIRARTLYQANAHEWADRATLTPLEPALSDIPLPVLGGEGAEMPIQPLESTGGNSTDAQVLQAVIETLESGAPGDALSIMKKTGLPLSQVRRALKMVK